MLEIILTVCLIGNPYKCREVASTYEVETIATPQMCQINATVAAAKWIDEHPEYVVSRFGCRRAGLSAKL